MLKLNLNNTKKTLIASIRMGNRHDVYIWDADVYDKPQHFEEAMDMAQRLAKQRIERASWDSFSKKSLLRSLTSLALMLFLSFRFVDIIPSLALVVA